MRFSATQPACRSGRRQA